MRLPRILRFRFAILGMIFSLCAGNAFAQREVILNFEELTITPGTVFGLNGFARSDQGIVTNVSVFIGDNKITEFQTSESPVTFNLLLSNSIPGDLPMLVKARDTTGVEFSSRSIPLHFPSRLTSRIVSPTNGAIAFLGKDCVIRVEAEIDFGTLTGVAASWQRWPVNSSETDATAPYEIVFRPELPGRYELRSVALVRLMDGTTLSDPVTIDVLPEGLPVITRQPTGRDLRPGETLELSVESYARGEQRFQWLLNSIPIPGATNSMYTIANASKQDDGFYCVTIDNFAGRIVSDLLDISVSAGGGLFFFSNQTTNIDAQIISAGQEPTMPPYIQVALMAGPAPNRLRSTGFLLVATNGYFDAGGISLTNVEPGEKTFVQVFAKDEIPLLLETGLYGGSKRLELVAGASDPTPLNGLESFTLAKSSYLFATLTNSPTGPIIAGDSISLGAFANASPQQGPIAYQWNKNGIPISGATSPSLEIPNAQISDAGYYSVTVMDDQRVRVAGQAVAVEDRRPQLQIAADKSLVLHSEPQTEFTIETSSDLRSWSVWKTNTTSGAGSSVWDTNPEQSPIYFRAKSAAQHP